MKEIYLSQDGCGRTKRNLHCRFLFVCQGPAAERKDAVRLEETVFYGNQSIYQVMKGGKIVGKRIIEKGALRVRWLLLCAAVRSFWQELLQQPKQTEYIRSRHRRRNRARKTKRRLF